MRVRLTGQQFGRCLSHALGTIASLQPPVVQEELQQRQVIGAQVPPEEEVTPKPAVEVLHQRTGPNRPPGQRGHCRLDVVEPAAKSPSYDRFLSPAPRVVLVARQDAEELPEQPCGDLELLPQQLQLLIESASEGEAVVSLVLQPSAGWPQPMRTQRRTALQFGPHEVVQRA